MGYVMRRMGRIGYHINKGGQVGKVDKKDANPKKWFQVMPPVPNKILQKI